MIIKDPNIVVGVVNNSTVALRITGKDENGNEIHYDVLMNESASEGLREGLMTAESRVKRRIIIPGKTQ